MAAFTVWALLVGPPDAAHAGERAVAAHADAVSAYCATPPKTATR
ncbi:hypothetical protein [Ralstonia syzygii]|uniref:Uncharacterized protein n=2 Tax=Ralstonia syzygii TaxID=28097 RepID=G3A0G8_9RALS|nr:hypothetical protein [Ralstonia syzygii]CCA84670.1 conserved hypothetical protein [Ralstonia syzygii R24]